MNRAIFLDRDGTLIEEKNYLSDVKDVILLPYVIEGLKKLQSEGYLLIIITNQSGVARGYFNEKNLKKINFFIEKKFLKEGIKISHTYYCPHYKNGIIKKYAIDCNCRKPKPGMINIAIKDFNINKFESFVIGDKESDMELAKNSCCGGVFIKTKNYDEPKDETFIKVNNILEAADFILKSKER